MNVTVEKLYEIIGALTVENALLRDEVERLSATEQEPPRKMSEVEIAQLRQVAHEA